MSPSVTAIQIAIPVTVALVLVYDVYLMQDDVPDNTYSAVLKSWFKKMRWLYYAVSFSLGVLMAHWGPE